MWRAPDLVIGGDERPYLRRWHLFRCRLFGVFLHEILRDDDDRALHDHPWWNVSIILKGGYLEWRNHHWEKQIDVAWHGPGSIVIRSAETSHRLSLGSERKPCWSLFIVGPRVREWGFWCSWGWRRWQDFVATHDRGQIGRGCE